MLNSICFASIVVENATSLIVASFHHESKGRVAEIAMNSLSLSYNRMGTIISIASSRPDVGNWQDIYKMPDGKLMTVVTRLSLKAVDHL